MKKENMSINNMKSDLPSEIAEEYKELLLQTFSTFTSICSGHNIKYFAAYGTLLGTIRHHGLIPWDDDIDVYMFREDYEKLLALGDVVNRMGYEVREWTQKGYIQPFPKFCHKNSTICPHESPIGITGMFIDIFILDYMNGADKMILIKSKIYRTLIQIYMHAYLPFSKRNIPLFILSFFSITFGRLFYKQLYRIIRKIEKQFKSGKRIVSTCGPYREKEIFKPEIFSSSEIAEFENMHILIPKGYHEYLSQLYSDYLKLPPEEKRVSNHDIYYLNLKKSMKWNTILNDKASNKNGGYFIKRAIGFNPYK